MLDHFIPRIAVSFLPCHASSRLKFRGVVAYAREFGPWEFNMTPLGRENSMLDLKTWKPDGFIGHIFDQEIADELLQSGIPMVIFEPKEEWVAPRHPLSSRCRVECDSEMIGKISAQFFIDRNFRQLGFVGEPEEQIWATRREKTFVAEARKLGIPCHVFPQNPDKDADWESRQSRLRKWLLNLPKPIGICTSSDIRGRQILDCCMVAGLKVPAEIAVLGADNDEFFCMTSQPTLSSVLAEYELGGYEGACMLHQLMQGKRPRKKVFYYGIQEIIQRESTRVIPVDNEMVAQAMEFIYMMHGCNIRVSDVVKHAGVSRRTLENCFQKSLGRSILETIIQQRTQSLREQVLKTDMSIKQLAMWAGLESTSHLSKLFKETFGMSITEYRKKNLVDSPIHNFE
ncbi:MAG: XylR family transcriptional regulator [Planctomycetia bacterium]|nr:XylR family transcriptional regulator [Planctomycetia bacterium]